MNLRSIHRWVANPFAIIPMCIAILVCNLNFVSAVPPGHSSNDFTGREMFRGVFFAGGAYADQIPELHELKLANFTTDETKLATANTIENNVMNEIERQSPRYFDNFRAALLSRNHVTIEDALFDGKKRVISTLEAVGIPRDKATEERLVADLSKRIDISKANAADLSAAVKSYVAEQGGQSAYVNYPIIYVWYVMIIIVFFVYESEPGWEMKMQGLFFDELVNSIASKS